MEKIACVKKSTHLRVREGFFWFFCAFKFVDILPIFTKQCFLDPDDFFAETIFVTLVQMPWVSYAVDATERCSHLERGSKVHICKYNAHLPTFDVFSLGAYKCSF
jgi:hypothetical protein